MEVRYGWVLAVIIGVAGVSCPFMNADNPGYDTETDAAEDSNLTPFLRPTDTEALSGLPAKYYVLALLFF